MELTEVPDDLQRRDGWDQVEGSWERVRFVDVRRFYGKEMLHVRRSELFDIHDVERWAEILAPGREWVHFNLYPSNDGPVVSVDHSQSCGYLNLRPPYINSAVSEWPIKVEG